VNASTGRIPLPKISAYRCFACGTANPIGLKMSFYYENDQVCSDIVLSENHAGWETTAHGGILSTLLDEVMGWAVITFRRALFVTRKMEVRYLRPVEVGVPLTVRGAVEPSPEQGRCKVKATISDAEGRLLVRGWAEMAYLSEKRLASVPEKLHEKMARLFEQIEQALAV